MSLQKLGKLNFENQKLLLIGATCAFSLALVFHKKYKRPEILVSKQDSAVNVNSLFLKLLAIGNKRLIADTLWIQTLIESDLENYKGNNLNSWMYLRFLSIAELDPNFYENYLFGGQYLSIIKDDVQGASEIMTRGLKYYPDDYQLNFNQGFNYYFEMEDIDRGLPHLKKIQHHPKAPKFIPSLVIKLQYEVTHDLKFTLMMLKEAYERAEDKMLRQKLEADLYAVKAEIDLECLNKKKDNCESRDAYGEPYMQADGVYKTSKPILPYKIHRRESKVK
ncbi:MAG TPA: hypothetical protein VNJ08_00045 [Bacteriovoracaceae bacterium]|nr:hypothetical protein [Bacteriovoracaceae bacterium]